MVVSVNGVLLWKVRDELLQYDIGKLILINPLMNDDFKKSAIRIILEKSKVSKKASIAENVQIITDETSNVIIDDNVVISNGSVIIATDNSTVHIGEQSCIGRDNIIRADSNSQVIIGQRSVIGNNNHIVSNFYSHICLEKENYFGVNGKINSIRNSQVLLKQKCSVGDMCVIGGNDTGNIIIGDRT